MTQRHATEYTYVVSEILGEENRESTSTYLTFWEYEEYEGIFLEPNFVISPSLLLKIKNWWDSEIYLLIVCEHFICEEQK